MAMQRPQPGANMRLPQGPPRGADPAALTQQLGNRSPDQVMHTPDSGEGFASIAAQSLGQAGQIMHSAAQGKADRGLAREQGDKNRQVEQQRTAAIERDAQLQRDAQATENRLDREARVEMQKRAEQLEIFKYGAEVIRDKQQANISLLYTGALPLLQSGDMSPEEFDKIYQTMRTENAGYGNITVGDMLTDEGRAKLSADILASPAMGGHDTMGQFALAMTEMARQAGSKKKASENLQRMYTNVDQRYDLQLAEPAAALLKSLGAITKEVESPDGFGGIDTEETVIGFKGIDAAIDAAVADREGKKGENIDMLSDVLQRATVPGFTRPAETARQILAVAGETPLKVGAAEAYAMRNYFDSLSGVLNQKANATEDKEVKKQLHTAATEAFKVAQTYSLYETPYHMGKQIKQKLRELFRDKQNMTPKEFEARTQAVADEAAQDFSDALAAQVAMTGPTGAANILGDVRNYLLGPIAPDILKRIDEAAQIKSQAHRAAQSQYSQGIEQGAAARAGLEQGVGQAAGGIQQGLGMVGGFLGPRGQAADSETQDVDVDVPQFAGPPVPEPRQVRRSVMR